MLSSAGLRSGGYAPVDADFGSLSDVFAAFFGILDDAVRAAQHAEHVLHRRPQALEHLRDVELVRQREPRLVEDDDVAVFHVGAG